MGRRLTIGLMIHHLENDYSRAVLNGAAAAAKDHDVDLAIFPGRSLNCQLDNTKYTAYEYQNNIIYSYVSAKMLDAVVVSAGTVGSFVSHDEFRSFLDGYGSLPVLTMENKVEGYPCIRMSGSGIRDIVNHLIREHGRKCIAFVSGPKGNSDADERLDYYREALEENGIPFDQDMVVYGKFSEYCVDIVGELIDRHEGKIDAICFANDMMCKGGYKAIEKRGLKVGKDIAVTGYDDSEVAAILRPRLTTVRADASLLGYRAVEEAIRLARKEKVGDTDLGSMPVYRFSCGDEVARTTEIEKVLSTRSDSLVIADGILSEQIKRYSEVLESSEALREFRNLTALVLDYAAGADADTSALSRASFRKAVNSPSSDKVSIESMVRIAKNIRTAARHVCMKKCPERVAEVDDISHTHFLIANIAKDMTLCGNEPDKSFYAVVNNLYRCHMKSSYIYLYSRPISHSPRIGWVLPDTVYLKAYHDGDRLATVSGESQRIASSAILNNMYTPSDRQRTMVVFPLYMNEEQYGTAVFETENEYFSYVYSIMPQISTGIKLSDLVGQLEIRNSQLSRMSMFDELTGIYNRRGFYAFANKILRAGDNEGRKAIVIFGDLDNLKKINDSFGHDDGDYAITSAAGILKNSLRNSDVVGRIGGDEFAAFVVCDDSDMPQRITERIKSMAELHNNQSTKPYNVTISIGVYELTCSPGSGIQQYMEFADSALYEDKKRKNPDIMKH